MIRRPTPYPQPEGTADAPRAIPSELVEAAIRSARESRSGASFTRWVAEEVLPIAATLAVHLSIVMLGYVAVRGVGPRVLAAMRSEPKAAATAQATPAAWEELRGNAGLIRLGAGPAEHDGPPDGGTEAEWARLLERWEGYERVLVVAGSAGEPVAYVAEGR